MSALLGGAYPSRSKRLVGPVGDYLLYTLAAQLTTLPMILYHLQRIKVSTDGEQMWV